MTEIILGGWDNKASAIRLNGDKGSDFKVDTPNLLSSGRFSPFIIDWINGHLSVRDGNGKLIIERKDAISFPVTHIGVRTAWGATGKWRLNIGSSLPHAIGERMNISKLNSSGELSDSHYSIANCIFFFIDFDFKCIINCKSCCILLSVAVYYFLMGSISIY